MRRLPSQHRWGRAGTARDVFVRRDYRILSETCQPKKLLLDFPPAKRRGSVVSDLPPKTRPFRGRENRLQRSGLTTTRPRIPEGEYSPRSCAARPRCSPVARTQFLSGLPDDDL